MVIILKHIIIATVIYFKLSLYSTSFIQSYFDGNLINSWEFDFILYADDIEGVILYCIDSTKNRLLIDVKTDRQGKKYVRLIYDKIFQYLPLEQIYGCDHCWDMWVYFRIRSINRKIYAKSNEKMFISMSNDDLIGIRDYEKSDNVSYPIPPTKFGDTDKIFAMIGNIGPFVGLNNVTVSAFTEQLSACLNHFYYNSVLITFEGGGTYMRPSCPMGCYGDSCNGGLCHFIRLYRIYCDCSSTTLNGLFCNKMLRTYVKVSNNSYEKIKGANEVYLKITWKQSLEQNYCLMDIVRGFESDIIWTNGTRLMIGSTFIRNIRTEKINFVSVNVTNNYLTVKSENVEFNFTFPLHENTRINVGFSEVNFSCQTFEGIYDVYYDKVYLRRVRHGNISPSVSTAILINSISTSQTISVETNKTVISEQKTQTMALVIIGSCIMWAIVLTIWTMRKRLKKYFNYRILHESAAFNPITNGITEYNPYDTIDVRKLYHRSQGVTTSHISKRISSVGVTVPQLPPRNDGTLQGEELIIIKDITEYILYDTIDVRKLYLDSQGVTARYIAPRISSANVTAPQLPPRNEESVQDEQMIDNSLL